MRKREQEINVRVFPNEKKMIQKKARSCGMNMSEYLRSAGLGEVIREAPQKEFMLACQKLGRIKDGNEELEEIYELLLQMYYGKENADGSDENMGGT